jgi:hypothetical protein
LYDWLFILFRHDFLPMGPARSVSPKAHYLPRFRLASCLRSSDKPESRGAPPCFRMMGIAYGALWSPSDVRLMRPPSREGMLPRLFRYSQLVYHSCRSSLRHPWSRTVPCIRCSTPILFKRHPVPHRREGGICPTVVLTRPECACERGTFCRQMPFPWLAGGLDA